MRLLDLLRLLRNPLVLKFWPLLQTIAANFQALADFSTDKEKLRAWLQTLADTLDPAADLTTTEIDDEAVATLRAVIASDDVYDQLHTFLVTALGVEIDQPIFMAPPPVTYMVAGDPAPKTISPAAIMALIELIRMVVAFVRDLRERRAA